MKLSEISAEVVVFLFELTAGPFVTVNEHGRGSGTLVYLAFLLKLATFYL